MSEEERIDWLIVATSALATVAIVSAFGWCLWKWRQAAGTDEQPRWLRWTILSGIVALLWVAHMTWALIDWSSHPLNN